MNGEARRKVIIDYMQNLDREEINCFSCDGHCCSSRSNSMQITPLETQELLDYLQLHKRWNSELKAKLSECINEYRLDKEISTGKNTTFRRTYTCPFYTPGSKGCSISPKAKPYGCLAFNPRSKNIDLEQCQSDLKLLELRELEFEGFESQKNQELKEQYQLWWDKLPIPYALLEFSKRRGQ